MGKINMSRVLLGGVVAWAVGQVQGLLVDGMMLAPQWAEGLKALGKSDLSASSWIWNLPLQLGVGILSIWLYAAIRAHYGPGAWTAVRAGVATWVGVALLPNAAFMLIMDLFAPKLMAMTTLGGLFGLVGGAVAGAALYKDAASGFQSIAARP